MMESNVPSKVIMERSGHLSKDGLVPYERTTAVQHQTSSRDLVPIENMKEKSVEHSTEESSEESSSTYQCEQSKEIVAEEKENVFLNDVLKLLRIFKSILYSRSEHALSATTFHCLLKINHFTYSFHSFICSCHLNHFDHQQNC